MNSRGIIASTPAHRYNKSAFGENKLPSSIGSPPQATVNVKKSKVLDSIVEAISDIGVPRKGASCQAIKKWMIENKGSDPQRLKSQFKVAVKKGIDEGILQRPQGSSSAVGATGSLMLVKQLKASKRPVSKSAAPPDETKVLKKANKASNDDGKRGTEVKQSKKKVTKNPKISPKKDEAKSATKTKKLLPRKAPLKAKAEKKPASKVNSKAKLANHDEELSGDDQDLSESQSEEDPSATKVISSTTRGKLERNDALVFSESEEESPSSKLASGAATKKKNAKTKAVKNNVLTESDTSESEEKPSSKVTSGAAAKRKPKPAKTKAMKNVFTESDKDKENTEVIPEAQKANAKAPAKNKAEKINVTKAKPAKAEDASSAKNRKGDLDKDTQKPANHGILNDQVSAGSKNPKKVNNKKLYKSDKELEERDFSDTEINVKKKHFKMFKTFASDSEFEISRSEEKKPKRAGRGKKNNSKL